VDPKLGAQHLTALYEAETSGGELFASRRIFTRNDVKRIVGRAVDTFRSIYG
jgi:hypothetical protein